MVKLVFLLVSLIAIFHLTLANSALLPTNITTEERQSEDQTQPCTCQSTYTGLFCGSRAQDAAGSSGLPAILSGSCQPNYVLDFLSRQTSCPLGHSARSESYSNSNGNFNSKISRSRCNGTAVTPAKVHVYYGLYKRGVDGISGKDRCFE